jgi:hypothetical protein
MARQRWQERQAKKLCRQVINELIQSGSLSGSPMQPGLPADNSSRTPTPTAQQAEQFPYSPTMDIVSPPGSPKQCQCWQMSDNGFKDDFAGVTLS